MTISRRRVSVGQNFSYRPDPGCPDRMERCPLHPHLLDVHLLRDHKGVVDLDSKITHGAFNLRMSK